MKYFNEVWYRSGCPRNEQYAIHYSSIQKELPFVFQQNASFHDAQIQAIRIDDTKHGKHNIIIDFDPFQSMTTLRHLVFQDADIQLDAGAIGGWCVADQVYAEADRYRVNLLVVDRDNDLFEIGIVFLNAYGE